MTKSEIIEALTRWAEIADGVHKSGNQGTSLLNTFADQLSRDIKECVKLLSDADDKIKDLNIRYVKLEREHEWTKWGKEIW